MSDIVVTGYNKAEGDSGEVSCAKLNKYGVQIKDMCWIDYDGGEEEGVWYGWYDNWDGENYLGNDPIEPGQGLWTQCDTITSETFNELSFQNAGQVAGVLTTVALTNGAQLVACCVPRLAKMEEIIISGYEPTEGDSGEVSCAKLNKYGVQIKDMCWIDYDGGEEEGVWYGWYDNWDGENYLGNDPIAAGEGLWMQCDTITSETYNSLYVNFPKGIKD